MHQRLDEIIKERQAKSDQAHIDYILDRERYE